MATRYIFYYKPDMSDFRRHLHAVQELGGYNGWFAGKIDDSEFGRMEPEWFERYRIQEIPANVAHAIVFSQITPYPEKVSGEVPWQKSVYEGECVHTYDEDGNYVSSYWTAADKTLDFSVEGDPKAVAPKLPGKYTLTDEDIANGIEASKMMKIAVLKERMEKEFLLLQNGKTPLERATWAEQARQATLYRQTQNEGDAPLIGQLANARGRTFLEQLEKVEEKIAEWNSKVATVLAPYQRRVDYISSATTFREIYNYENPGAVVETGAAVLAEPPADY